MYSRILSRRQMTVWCITLSGALALCIGLQGLLGWGRTQLDTGAALAADTLRLHIRAASDTTADQTDKLAGRGSFAPVRVYLVEMYFGTTRYSASALPAGRYQALRIDIGAAPYGRNWWCVLYPGLCRTACGGYAAPAENDLVCGRYLLRFKCVEWWQKHTARREDVILLG